MVGGWSQKRKKNRKKNKTKRVDGGPRPHYRRWAAGGHVLFIKKARPAGRWLSVAPDTATCRSCVCLCPRVSVRVGVSVVPVPRRESESSISSFFFRLANENNEPSFPSDFGGPSEELIDFQWIHRDMYNNSRYRASAWNSTRFAVAHVWKTKTESIELIKACRLGYRQFERRESKRTPSRNK